MKRIHILLPLTLLLCVLLAAAVSANDAVYALLAEADLPQLFGETTFKADGVAYQRLLLPRYLLEQFPEEADAPKPGDRSQKVEEVKRALYSNDLYPHNEMVTYTQVRPEVVQYFDEHLALFLQTLYQFCGLPDKEPQLDGLTLYLLDKLPAISAEMRNDIEIVYKYNMVKNDTKGTINRDGTADKLYYFAQTDPDWAEEIFEFEGNGATLKDRGCGCACAAMVFSTYHMVEITPRWMRTYALEGNWPVSYGLPNEYFEGIAKKYTNLEKERYGTVLESPVIVPKNQLDMEQLADQIGNKGYMGIIHVVAGAFTSHEHYMVLADYEVIDGEGYFLVADPYVQPSRYRDTDQMRDVPGDNQGLVYAKSSLLYRDCKSVILFQQDRNAFPQLHKAAAPERIDRAGKEAA